MGCNLITDCYTTKGAICYHQKNKRTGEILSLKELQCHGAYFISEQERIEALR